EFYFRTHRKKDQSWVGPHAKSTYEKFEKRKFELSSQNSTFAPGEDGDNSQSPTTCLLILIYGWKEKGRIFGLESRGRTMILSSSQPSKSSTSSGDVDALRSQIQKLNESLQRQEQENFEIRHELTENRKQMHTLIQYLRF
ncbi:hypothetical protein CR513_50106, partial [Mucuna pruriens]